jgi:hypothetical protein
VVVLEVRDRGLGFFIFCLGLFTRDFLLAIVANTSVRVNLEESVSLWSWPINVTIPIES